MQCSRRRALQQSLAELKTIADNSDVYVSLLRHCKSVEEGELVHHRIRENGQDSDTFVGNHLVRMYGELGHLHEARCAFEKINRTNVFSWTILLTAYAQNGDLWHANDLFRKMPSRNAVSWTTMLVVFSQHGCVRDAKEIFDASPERDAVSWNSLISAYAKNGEPERAVKVFRTMLLAGTRPSEVSFVCVLEACANLEAPALTQGGKIHNWLREAGLDDSVKLANALVHVYGRCGCLSRAKSCFDNMLERNIVSWNAMILAFTLNNAAQQAIETFNRMASEGVRADEVTIMSVAEACGVLQDGVTARLVHMRSVENKSELDLKVGTALVNMFGKCNQLEEAKQVFRSTRHHDVVLWTAMLTAYAQTGYSRTAIHFLKKMDLEGITPNNITLVCAFDICGNISALSEGKALHSSIVSLEDLGSKTWNSILSMYGKCGSLASALSVFQTMPSRDAVSWNALLAAFAGNEKSHHVLELYKLMQLDGMTPNVATFTSILAACGRVGLLNEGCRHFGWIEADYGTKASVDHYRCMVDLLARAGRIKEAETLVACRGLSRDDISWNTLLAACKMHQEMDHGAQAANGLALVDPENSASYVILSSMYATSPENNERHS